MSPDNYSSRPESHLQNILHCELALKCDVVIFFPKSYSSKVMTCLQTDIWWNNLWASFLHQIKTRHIVLYNKFTLLAIAVKSNPDWRVRLMEHLSYLMIISAALAYIRRKQFVSQKSFAILNAFMDCTCTATHIADMHDSVFAFRTLPAHFCTWISNSPS